MTKTANAQPAIFLVSWLALQLLRERVPGFSFQAAAGLSLGELTALTAAGVFEFGDGLKLARQRGRFMQEACERTRGGMAAVLGLDVEATRAVCAEADVEVANLNCPGQIVISGETEKIARACQLAKSKGAKRAVRPPGGGGVSFAPHGRRAAQGGGDAGRGVHPRSGGAGDFQCDGAAAHHARRYRRAPGRSR